MQKLHHLLLFVCLFPVSLFAQERTKIFVDRFERGTVDNKTKTSYLRKPVFRQDNAILTCDSAVFYEDRNVFEAFKNVHINQADTINIYSDRLTYDGNTKIAHLTSNVRMLDRTSVLTTNVLDYDMNTKVGTYINGGKIVNKDVTLTSRNGYYFANSRDAYFRYNVLVVTPQTTIKSDTLRYNTLTNWTYFYGPTNIKGKDDNLYTENGAYNTKTEYAYFGKKNLYTTGSKSLKGDSLYYDGIAGYGKAVRNIFFRDTTDNTLLRGQLGEYYKADERTVVTRNAYVGLGTKDSITIKDVKHPDTLWLGADTLETVMVLRNSLKLLPLPVIQSDDELGEVQPEDEGLGLKEGQPNDKAAEKSPKQAVANEKEQEKIKQQDDKQTAEPPKIPPGKEDDQEKLKTDELPKAAPESKKKKRRKAKEDAALQTDSTTNKSSQVAAAEAKLKTDSVALNAVKLKTDSASLKQDTTLHKAEVLKTDSLKKGTDGKNLAPGKKVAVAKAAPKDSVKVNPLDTVKARTIKAYHNVKVFKTNLQARADSLFYTSADSTLRWFNNPIIWSEGSQQTGDTIYLQLRNNKLNSVQVLQNGFTVNVYKDSTRFNQIKGKLMTGFFIDGKLTRMFVDGNSESVYFSKTDKGDYDKMNRTISSRIKILFKNDEISEIVPIKDVEGTATEANQVKEEVILTGFIWKPENRPTSKFDITNPKSAAKPKTSATAKTGGKPTAKTPLKTAGKTPSKAAGKGGVLTPKPNTTLKSKAKGTTDQATTATKNADSVNTLKTDSLKRDTVKTPATADPTVKN